MSGDEKLRILTMVEEGKISAGEAGELISVLEDVEVSKSDNRGTITKPHIMTRKEESRLLKEEQRLRIEEERLRAEEERLRVEEDRLRIEEDRLRAEEERLRAKVDI